jgi:DNA-binding response OmpR family regulator
LVDDSEIVGESVKRWLERDGYQVIVARNCAEARLVAGGRHFAGSILDLELADGNGVELALWLKSDGHCPETVFFTGHSIGSDSLERAQQVGCVVTKGADPNGLLRVLRDLVERNR